MREKLYVVCISLFVLGLGFGSAQGATLSIESVCGSPGETVVINVMLDNTADGAVAASQMDINFDTSVFAVDTVLKTDRSMTIDLFMFSRTASGITFVCTGIGHSIAAGTGSIGEITVEIAGNAANGSYVWSPTGVILSDPFGVEYSVTTEDGTFDVPCNGGEGAILSLNCDEIGNGTVYVELDNTTVGNVAAGEMIITFDKSEYTVVGVIEKTERTAAIDLFLSSDQPEGISFVFTGIGHYIEPGTGPIAALNVTGSGSGEWCFAEGSIIADPLGVELPHEIKCCKPSGIDPVHLDLTPTQYALSQNYPNPFNPTTSLDLAIPSSQMVNAVVYNVMGQKVRELVNNEFPAGYYTLTWDGLNDQGQAVTSGVYFLHVKTGTMNKSVKMLLLK